MAASAAPFAILREAPSGRSSECVNLSILAVFNMSQIKDLAWSKIANVE
jgi:hypothetical protein